MKSPRVSQPFRDVLASLHKRDKENGDTYYTTQFGRVFTSGDAQYVTDGRILLWTATGGAPAKPSSGLFLTAPGGISVQLPGPDWRSVTPKKAGEHQYLGAALKEALRADRRTIAFRVTPEGVEDAAVADIAAIRLSRDFMEATMELEELDDGQPPKKTAQARRERLNRRMVKLDAQIEALATAPRALTGAVAADPALVDIALRHVRSPCLILVQGVHEPIRFDSRDGKRRAVVMPVRL